MGKLFIYEDSSTNADFTTCGLCGPLIASEVKYKTEAFTFGELEFKHPKDTQISDSLSKWKCIKPGRIIKAPVPVRLCPDFDDDGAYVKTVLKSTIKNTLSDSDLQMYNKAKDGKKIGKAKRGAEVIYKTYSADQDRVKVKVTYTYKKNKKTKTKVIEGWIAKNSIKENPTTVNVEQTSYGLEYVISSYAIQDQFFRIYDVKISDSNGEQELEVSCKHIVYDLLGNLSTYCSDTSEGKAEVSCQTVCKGILDNTVEAHDFTIHSDVADTRVGFDARNKNPISALLDGTEGVVKRWSGVQPIVNNYDIYVLQQSGMDRGLRIEYGKNMTGVTCETDMTDVTVAIRPVGEKKNGSPLYLDGVKAKDFETTGHYCYMKDDKKGTYSGDDGHKYIRLLKDGYKFYTNSNGTLVGSVVLPITQDNVFPYPKIAPLDVSEATVGDGLDTSQAMYNLVSAAVDEFETNKCNKMKIELDVDFQMLGDTDDYSQYKNLTPLFIYDTVLIRHKPLGISSRNECLSFEWDVLMDRPTKAEFGAIKETSWSVASWQISSVSGGSIINGTVTSSTIASDSITEDHIQENSISTGAIQASSITSTKIAASSITSDKIAANSITSTHIQANSINTDALQAKAITAEKIASDAITADKIKAHEITSDKIEAGLIEATSIEAVNAKIEKLTADDISTDKLAASIANLGILTAGDATIRRAVVETLMAAALTVTDASEENVYIDNLMVRSAQMIEATIGTLICKASNDKYYRLDFDDSGNIKPVEVTVSVGELTAGVTSDGTRRIIETALTVDELGASNFKAITGIINKLTADQINVGTLFANKAFITQLNTSQIYGGKSFELIVDGLTTDIGTAQGAADGAQDAADKAKSAADKAQDAADKAQDAAGEAQSAAGKAQGSADSVGSDLKRMLRLNSAGLHVGDNQTSNEVLIDSESVNIVMNGVKYSQFGADYVQFGNYQLRKSADGGLVFKIKE